MEKVQITVSAGELAEYCFPQGSLGSAPTVERMFEGTAAHKKLQNLYAENEKIQYKREVPMEILCEKEKCVIKLQGRADGVYFDKKSWYIHEIKSTYCDAKAIDTPLKAAHKAQMMIYCYIFCHDNNLSEIKAKLSYFCLSDQQIVDFEYSFNFESLEHFVAQMTDEYGALAVRRIESAQNFILSAQEISFPFDNFRKGQREGAAQVYSAIKNGRNLFLQAPTGAGKTMMVLFPVIKAIADDYAKVFCLSAKNQTLTVNEKAIEILRKKGLKIKSCTISAKSKCCFMETEDCSPDVCPYSLDFFPKMHNAMKEIINDDFFTFEKIASYAKKYEVCPYELSLAISEECDVIICDYNYLFDPSVYLRRFFDVEGKYVFLVDEAHNLVERGRDMYSAFIKGKDLTEIKKLFTKDNPLYKCFSKVLTELNKTVKEDEINEEHFQKLKFAILSLSDQMMKSQSKTNVPSQAVLLEKDLMKFVTVSDFYDPKNFVLFSGNRKDLTLQCIDASEFMEKSIEKGQSTILYSATLSPYEFYKNNILPEQKTYGFQSEYPFNKENLTVFCDYSIDTRYKNRDNFYEKIANNIKECRKCTSGNIFAFFPSFAFMKNVAEYFDEVLIQNDTSDQQERLNFLSDFSSKENALAFAVMGSHYSEGIDIPNLKGIIIVGVALPQYNEIRQNIQDHFEEKYQKGFDYAYVYPGINKVCQAAGRLIRKESDSGFLFLMDSRFRQYKYLLPDYWHIDEVSSRNSIESILKTQKN